MLSLCKQLLYVRVKMNKNLKRMTFDVPADFHKRLKMFCAKNNCTMQRVIIEGCEKVMGGERDEERRF